MNTTKKRINRIISAVLTVLVMLSASAYAADENLFTIGVVTAAGSALNPFACNQRDLVNVNELVFESVIDFDDNLKPVGELALSWTQSGGVYTFKLRDNVRFHDGTYLSAQDVYASYTHIKSLGESSPYYARCQYISSMEVTDLYTVTVKGKYPTYLVLYAMTFPVAQRNTVTWELAVGTGPYKYTGYDLDWIQIDFNPYWWKVSPTVATIFGYRYDETADALRALSSGEIDALATRSQDAALSRLLSDRTSVDYTTLTYEILVPDLGSTLFSHVYTRQALMYALDISTIASNIYMDMVTESEVPVVPGSWLYETQSAVYYESRERALQLLYLAGWGDFNSDGILDHIVDGVLEQFEFTLLTYVDDTAMTRTHAAELIRDQLRPLGIVVNVVTKSKSDVSRSIRKDEFDMVLCGVNLSLVPDLAYLLASNGSLNYSGYSDAGMQNLLQAIYETTDETQLKFLYSQVQLKFVDELPFLGLFFRKGTLMTTAHISGLGAIRENDALRGIEFITFN